MKSRLGVNVDHIATLRNARGEGHPDPVSYARQVMNFGANSITIHLRAVSYTHLTLPTSPHV